MAKTSTVPFSQNFNTRLVTLNSASLFIAPDPGTAPTNTVELLTAGTNDTIVKAITMSSSDTTARTIAFYISSDVAPTFCNVGINFKKSLLILLDPCKPFRKLPSAFFCNSVFIVFTNFNIVAMFVLDFSVAKT